MIAQISHLSQKGSEVLFEIDFRSRIPIYEQIKNQIMTFIRLGIYKPNEQLPSIRFVSTETGVNVNTVKRAFQELEAEGVTYTIVGKGSFVDENALNNTLSAEKALANIKDEISSLKSKGVTREQLLSLIAEIYKEDSKDD